MKQEQFSIKNIPGLYGIVACGGKSSRMGTDKGALIYHEKQQRYHLYDMLESFCEQAFISCSHSQAETISKSYHSMPDLPAYNDMGPMAALLTAFDTYPGKDIILAGCDYPLLSSAELNSFIESCVKARKPAAFYDHSEEIYEPLLAFYPYTISGTVRHLFESGNRSLQHVLKQVDATKYLPLDQSAMNSIDTMEEHIQLKQLLKLEE